MDLFVPIGPNDYELFPYFIQGVLRFLPEVRNIHIATPHPGMVSTMLARMGIPPEVNARIHVWDEKGLGCPFTIDSVRRVLVDRRPTSEHRAGWYYQQLLKLYAPRVIQGILDTVLVVDADVIFLRTCNFLAPGTQDPIYTLYPKEYANSYVHDSYYNHMAGLVPEVLPAILDRHESFVSHHTILESRVLDELFRRVEGRNGGAPFWRVFLAAIQDAHIEGSGASEYEIYAYFRKHLAMYGKATPFRYRYMPLLDGLPNDLQPSQCPPYVFVGVHHWCRPRDWLSRLLDIQRASCLE